MDRISEGRLTAGLQQRLPPGPLLFIGYWLFFLVAGRTRLFMDPGTWWHTRVGELILEKSFFDRDPFTFTHANHYWIPHQWLGEVAMALLYRVAGFDTFLLAAATTLAGLFTWLTLRLMKSGLHVSVSVVIAAVALSATATHLHVRPILFTTIATAITMAILVDAEDNRRRLWWLVPLFWLWTQIHGGVVGGMAMLGLASGGWLFTNRRTAMIGFIVLAVTIMLSMATPYGDAIPRTWVKIMQGSATAKFIEEHQPLDVSKPINAGVLVFAALYLFVLFGLKVKPHITWLLPLFWMVQMVGRVRHGPLFAVCGTVAIAAMWPHTRYAARLLHRPDIYDPNAVVPRGRWWWLLPALLVFGLFVLQATGVWTGQAKPDPRVWPEELLPMIRSQPPGNVFNDVPFGGWLSQRDPRMKTFIDDRLELYSDEFFTKFMEASGQDPSDFIAPLPYQYGLIRYALVKPDTYFDLYFSRNPQWKRLGDCQAARFYGRIP